MRKTKSENDKTIVFKKLMIKPFSNRKIKQYQFHEYNQFGEWNSIDHLAAKNYALTTLMYENGLYIVRHFSMSHQ